MNNIVKIILGVNIAAGAAGAFFAYSKSSKIGDLKTAKDVAVGKEAAANKRASGFESDLKKTRTELSTKTGDISRLTKERDAEKKKSSSAAGKIAQANIERTDAQTEADQAKSELQNAQIEANKLPDLQTQLAQYEALGNPADLKTKLDEWARLKAATAPPPTKPKPKEIVGNDVGDVIGFQSGTGGILLNKGSSSQIKVGDKFTLFRGGIVVGKIIIRTVQPTISIAKFDPAFPAPKPPYEPGDKVKKID